MSLHTAIFLFAAGVLGGAINAVAGGGSFFTFPALLFAGLPPVPANATSTLALWFGVAGSGTAYRKQFRATRRVVIPFLTASVVGGLAGAFLLIRTPAETFLRVIPWLLLAATLLFAFGKQLTNRIGAHIAHDASGRAIALATVFEGCVAIYGGYFGGGMGIMNLALLSALGMADIHAMNALKVLLGGVTNGVATVTFIASKAIIWLPAAVMTGGAIAGGFTSAHFAQKLPQSWVRTFVIAAGSAMTLYFFWRAWH